NRRRIQAGPGMVPGAWAGTGRSDGPGTARAGVDRQRRRGQSASLARPAGDTSLDRPGPLVALQLRLPVDPDRHSVLRSALHHGTVGAAGAEELERDPERDLHRAAVRFAAVSGE